MKNKLILLTLISISAFFFSSCKKDKNEEPSSSYISWKMDGIQKTLTAKAVAVKVALGDINSIAFTAYQDNNSSETIYIQVSQKNKIISTGTYTDPGPDSDDLLVVAGYKPANATPANTFSAGLQEDNNPRLKVTITSLTDKNVSGSFSGTFYANDGEGPAISAFTDGKFNLPLN